MCVCLLARHPGMHDLRPLVPQIVYFFVDCILINDITLILKSDWLPLHAAMGTVMQAISLRKGMAV